MTSGSQYTCKAYLFTKVVHYSTSGQKPFKCPQCPVMFSTKSNRERHLVRKHGLNVLDPATRQMMDRPFKCHLCVFSSFSTSGKMLWSIHCSFSPLELFSSLMFWNKLKIICIYFWCSISYADKNAWSHKLSIFA